MSWFHLDTLSLVLALSLIRLARLGEAHHDFFQCIRTHDSSFYIAIIQFITLNTTTISVLIRVPDIYY